ncbi:DUF6804 family protein [Aequorivita sp. CIP111184]|uniref:DUF6804 family protein n=1 Tax=Aequorivita sp. CIP111184 TaxID=2211356 RepID=UPI002852C056|nr:DUF6804 family protein [Aequorivita sp. CIP111184]
MLFKIIILILAILLLVCLLKMSYGFYEMIRFLTLIGFGILAYQAINLIAIQPINNSI